MPDAALPTPSRKKILRAAAFVLLLALAAQFVYFASVYLSLSPQPPACDLVLVYSGPEDRTELFRDWTGPRPLFLFSGQDYNRWKLKREMESGKPFLLENRARTTDQNARYCAPLVEKTGATKVTLALPWYHLPRALFLTRYYLFGNKITVTPYATTPLPGSWWLNRNFYVEFVKFWGSLGRIALSWVGVETWPPPSSSF